MVTAVRPVLVTSVPPARIEPTKLEPYNSIELNLASFQANGFDINSVPRKGEQPDSLPETKITYSKSVEEGFFVGRYGPTFRDLFTATRGTIGAVVNSDVYMPKCNI